MTQILDFTDVLLDNGYNIVTIYAVHQGDSDVSCGSPVWWFDSSIKADNCARGRGWYGSNAPVSSSRAIKIGSQYLLLRSDKPVELGGPEDKLAKKQQILAKLTKEEQEILGL